jgi:hypothetical protein
VTDPLLVESLRRLLDSTPAGAVLGALTDSGWPELYASEPEGAGAALFELQGALLTSAPLLPAVMLLALHPGAGLSDRLVLPPFGDPGRPPATVRADGSVLVDGLVRDSPSAEPLLAATDSGTLVRLDPEALTITAVGGIDPDLGLARATGTAPALAPVDVAPVDGVPVDVAPVDVDWAGAVAAGRLCLATELAGNARAALAGAVQHARARTQFGRPIGAFQAVRHRLADAEIALQTAELAVAEGWRSRRPLDATLAKALAGTAGREVLRHAQQVFGGIGYTWEHGFHRRLRRGIALESLLGDTTTLHHELGTGLITADPM